MPMSHFKCIYFTNKILNISPNSQTDLIQFYSLAVKLFKSQQQSNLLSKSILTILL